MKNCIRQIALLALIGALAGCGSVPAAESVAAPPVVLQTYAPSPSPAAKTPDAETPTPDMVFEDDGDIYFSQAYAASFAPRTFAFDHPPRVLIYHTHTREAFFGATVAAQQTPQPGKTARAESTDPSKNVVRLGSLLDEALTARGFIVMHDATDCEPPLLATAYERSREVMEAYDDIDLYIDLHRNVSSARNARDDVVTLSGKRAARLFFVVGTGIVMGDTSGETANWRENYGLALALTQRLSDVDAQLVRPIRVKQRVYNQDMGLSLLAEIGHNANLLVDAENTVSYLADAIAAVCTF